MSTRLDLNDPSTLPELTSLIAHLCSFPTMKSLRRSGWFKENHNRLDRLLNQPHVENQFRRERSIREWIRCVSWNIEKGKNFEEIVRAFTSDSRLACADVILLQEVDAGMARSRNRFVARDLALALKMNFAFAPCWIELTRGVGNDLEISGENTLSLQGNALLTKCPIQFAGISRLPRGFEAFDCAEKRYGGRNGLYCDLDLGSKQLRAVCTHLEVRNTPRCRARQMSGLLQTISPNRNDPVLIAGDFNSNTFGRGTAWRTLGGYLRLTTTKPLELAASTLSPQHREPLFQVLRESGFEWEMFNDHLATGVTHLQSLEDLRFIPPFLLQSALRAVQNFSAGLPLRLDWFAGKNISVASTSPPAEISSESGGPLAPTTFGKLEDGTAVETIADHRPILLDVRISD